MQKLHNSVQHYAWGSHNALTALYGYPNPDNQPMAELWMGAHPKSSSSVLDNDGNERSLRDIIDGNRVALLGEAVAERFGELPFLFKVLCAAQPLSIQVHPSKHAAVEGFAKENRADIPLDASCRNYKDDNHKPELVYALTPFLAMNGFREFSEITELLQSVSGAHHSINRFLQQPEESQLSQLFASLLALEGEQKTRALAVLKSALNHQRGEPWDTLRTISKFYPNDSGLFSPLLLNVVKLAPGEAMFLFAETPHAYLEGIALEVMANSDNVLRAGLTQKYIDIPELIANVEFITKPASQLLMQPEQQGNSVEFPIPVDDFAFSIHTLQAQATPLRQNSAAIVFCIEGEAILSSQQQQLVLQPGESAFIAANESSASVSGNGRLARVYNKI